MGFRRAEVTTGDTRGVTQAAAQALLRRFGVEPVALRCVARLAHEVWRVRPRQGADLALRLYPAATSDAAAIDTELDWLAALADAGLHVPRPCRCADGERLLVAPDGRPAVLLTWLGGRQHDRGLTPARLRQVGRFTGAAHRIADAQAAAGRVRLQREAMPLDLAAWSAGTRRGAERLPAALRAVLRPAATRLVAEIESFGRAPDAWGFIHGDLHPWNLLFVRGAAGAIDFSDCGWGHRAMDLAATLQYLRHPLAHNHDHGASYAALHGALLEGYAAERPLPPGAVHQVDTLITARLFGTLEWMLDDWPAPDHRAWGPAFIDGACAALRDFVGR